MKKIVNCTLISIMIFAFSILGSIKVEANENILKGNISEGKREFAILTDCQNGEKYLCNIKNKTKSISDKSDDTYVVESEVQIAVPKEESGGIALLSNSITQEEFDGSLSWKAYIKTTYKKNGNKYLVTKTNGNWKCSDASVKISDRRVTYGCGQGQVGTKKPSGNTFSYSTGFTKYISPTSKNPAGSNSSCYLKRGTGKKWQLEVIANL